MMLKESVLLYLSQPMARVLVDLDAAHYDANLTRGAFITSAKDGTHMKGSKHHSEPDDDRPSDAVDLRTRDLTPMQEGRLAACLRKRLNGAEFTNSPYQVIVEANPRHIHVEYDPA